MQSRVSPLMMFRRTRARKTPLYPVLAFLLVPVMLLLAAVFVFDLGHTQASNGARPDSAAMVAAEALAGEFSVLSAALP